MSASWKLHPEKRRLLETSGHILALGGPGSGKTFVALLKAGCEAKAGTLLPSQRILFLSFARATIARVAQQARTLIGAAERAMLEINTYHGFAWNILRSHGYLLRKGSPVRLLPPPEAATRLADVEFDGRAAEKDRLFEEEGLLHFDLFAAQTAKLLSKSKKLTAILSNAYPTVILDEFQDTNAEEWELIQILGEKSRLIALADAEQRIYEFRGADPKRIGEFITAFKPAQFDFGVENNRSNGTDIAIFGNDLLTGTNKTKSYDNVSVIKYQVKANISRHVDLKIEVIKARQRLIKSGDTEWSLAILVPTRQLMLDLSEYLGEAQQFVGGGKLPVIQHDVALETNGPSLAAVLIAGLLEGGGAPGETSHRMISDLCGHIRGRSDSVAQGELQLAAALVSYVGTGTMRGAKRKLVAEECIRIGKERDALALSGDPSQDWLTMRQLLAMSTAPHLQAVAGDAKYLRLLHKGALLRSRLNELWRTNGNYSGAASVVREALLQEHFSASVKRWEGIHVMTIHKAKGKEFNETIIYEGAYQGRILRAGADERGIAQARLALRVAVTRAMKRVTIMTPRNNPCSFL